jgi:hypothetical protein
MRGVLAIAIVLVVACGRESETVTEVPTAPRPCSSQKECPTGDCVMDPCIVSPCTVGHCRK